MKKLLSISIMSEIIISLLPYLGQVSFLMCLGGTVKTESKSTSVFSVFIYLYILFAKLAFNLGAGQKEEKAKKFQKYC